MAVLQRVRVGGRSAACALELAGWWPDEDPDLSVLMFLLSLIRNLEEKGIMLDFF